ncbi:hypothetical protein BD408DRAFT_154043 [Parasitella parasitica]|nr:hypothetical protein BD408DRAFT_154043 [Parasitella parasitica]
MLSKVFAETCDNASSNTKLAEKLERLMRSSYENIKFVASNQRIPCMSHVINLVTQDLLKQCTSLASSTPPSAPTSSSTTPNILYKPRERRM